jgi:poly-gamma-glutamate synthesis protein (capsule biosynthesis protein)
MKMDLDKAKEISDIQIVSMHFGSEYQRLPNETQKKWVEWLSEEGADVVVGHHPHVLQPMEWVENSKGEKTLVIYSLGNFISNQKGNYKDIGGIAKFDIVKQETLQEKNFYIENPSFIPTFSGKNNEGDFKINLLSKNNPEIFKEIKSHMNQWIPDLIVE